MVINTSNCPVALSPRRRVHSMSKYWYSCVYEHLCVLYMYSFFYWYKANERWPYFSSISILQRFRLWLLWRIRQKYSLFAPVFKLNGHQSVNRNNLFLWLLKATVFRFFAAKCCPKCVSQMYPIIVTLLRQLYFFAASKWVWVIWPYTWQQHPMHNQHIVPS